MKSGKGKIKIAENGKLSTYATTFVKTSVVEKASADENAERIEVVSGYLRLLNT